MFTLILAWLGSVISWGGYLGFFLIVTLENFLAPIPSEVIMPLAGYLAYTHQFSFWIAFAVSVIAATLGSLLSYALGYYGGEPVIKRYGHWFLLDPSDLAKAHQWFLRYGSVTVFACRFLPGVRQVSSIPAGAAKMPLGRFIFWTALGSALWNGGLMALGYSLGPAWQRVTDYTRVFDAIVIVIIVVAFVYWWHKHGRAIVNAWRGITPPKAPPMPKRAVKVTFRRVPAPRETRSAKKTGRATRSVSQSRATKR